MTTSHTHPVAHEAAEALAASSARVDQTMAELAARVAERKAAGACVPVAKRVARPVHAVEFKPYARKRVDARKKTGPSAFELEQQKLTHDDSRLSELELRAQIEAHKKKLARKKNPLGRYRRLMLEQRVRELKAELESRKIAKKG